MSEFSPLWGVNEGYGACDDEEQDKAVSSPPLTPPRNAGRDKGLRDLARG